MSVLSRFRLHVLKSRNWELILSGIAVLGMRSQLVMRGVHVKKSENLAVNYILS